MPISLQPKAFTIGNVTVDPPLVLAPMAGVTDVPYRRLMSEHGAGMVTTEMVSAEGLRRMQPASWRLCAQDPELRVPLAVQIFGRSPAAVSEAAKLVEQSGASVIDINAGCPVRKVVRQGAGAGLLKTPDTLVALVEAARKAVSIPLTVKIRLGWDTHSIRVVELTKHLASAGADSVTIHARTAVQQYSGCADWSWIKRVKAEVDIPIIGNGDITSPALADRMLEETGCDGIMIGRASLGNPWLFTVIVSRWRSRGAWEKLPDWNALFETARAHFDAFRQYKPHCVGHLRNMLLWYSRGCPDASRLRSKLMELKHPDGMLCVFRSWVDDAAAKGIAFLPVKVPEVTPRCVE